MTLKKVKPLVTEHHYLLGFKNSAGPARSRFLVELRDNKRIMGVRCNQCNLVYVPPRPNCVKCLSEMNEWVEVSDKGTLTSYTTVYAPEQEYKKDTPFVFGIIQLDGADTGLVHFLGEIEPEELRVGMRVQAVFRKERTASILDIDYFKPL